MSLVLFPHQLFEHAPLDMLRKGTVHEIIVWEDPVFFGDRAGSSHGPRFLRLNRMRIIYMRVAIRMYIQYLHEKGANVRHVPVNQLWSEGLYTRYKRLYNRDVVIFDPTDHLLMKRIHKYAQVKSLTVMDSPSFLMTVNDITQYMQNRKGKRLQHSSYFDVVKRKYDILRNVESTDINNRQPFPQKGVSLPLGPFVTTSDGKLRTQLWQEEVQWLSKQTQLNKNAGSDEDVGYPITFADVRAWFDKFLQERFDLFGKYEDAVVEGSQWMYHSGLSIFLNMGLITPTYIVERMRHVSFTRRNNISSYEGFLRQLMGWREYARLYYMVTPPSTYKKNVFEMKNRAVSRNWYTGHTGNTLVDATIMDAWKYGYLHHIRRLMIMSNYMTLCRVHPDRVYAWMYEFSLDSWDWVMVFNVYSMGTWSDGGFAMRKPYISSANYLKRMARLKHENDINDWNKKYAMFLKDHKNILIHTQLANMIP